MQAVAPDLNTVTRSARVSSIDILRGMVMVIMALDHVREFWGPTPIRPEDVAQASVPLFLTRWVTHICAPTFLFLSGLSIYLYEKQKNSKAATSRFTVSRGIWLIAVEIAIMSFLVTHGYDMTLLSVLWAIGWSMILLGGLIWFPRMALLAIMVLMVAGHNLLPAFSPTSIGEAILGLLHNTPFFIPNPPVLVTYTIVPWVAVMLGGYLTGPWFEAMPERRDKLLRTAALVLLALFFIFRLNNGYGDPAPFAVQERGWIYTALSFVNVSKYPPSFLFIMLTIGVALLLLSWNRNAGSRINRFFMVYGRVPFFYFILHFALISLSSYLWTIFAFGQGFNLAMSQPATLPPAYVPSLARVYLVWILVLAVTYFPCKWFGEYRQRRKKWWLSYL